MIYNLFLSVIDLFLTMGLPPIDESLNYLLDTMAKFPYNPVRGMVGLARALGAMFAVGVGAYECWMMMLGRRGMDVLKLVRIVIISMCISWSNLICSVVKYPGQMLEATAMARAKSKNAEINAKVKDISDLQDEYLKRLRAIQDSIQVAKQTTETVSEGGLLGTVKDIWNTITTIKDKLSDFAKQAAVITETFMSELINDIIRFLGELIFQMSYYGMLLGQRIFMVILGSFAPVFFALSLLPAFSNAWSQWLGKFISLSLWGFVIYMILYYVDFLLIANLERDLVAYQKLVASADNSWGSIGALGIKGIGMNCFYVLGLIVGARLINMAPEVASWLIPNSISSSAGGPLGNAIYNTGGTVISHGGTVISSVKSPVSTVVKTTANTAVSGVSGGVRGGAEAARTGAQMGGRAGMSAGGQVGGAIGSVFGPAGAAAGQAFGAAVGGTAGAAVGGTAGAVGGGMAGAANGAVNGVQGNKK